MREAARSRAAERGEERLYLEPHERVELCHDVDFLAYLRGRCGIEPHQNGPGRFLCHSPFRDERTPSFTVFAPGIGRMGYRGWTWCDFGDGNRNGDALALEMELSGCTFPEAAHHLAAYTSNPEAWISDPSATAIELRRSAPSRSAPGFEYIPIATQRLAFRSLTRAITTVDPKAAEKGTSYLLSRGATESAIALMGPAYRIESTEVSDAIAKEISRDRDSFYAAIQAGICYDIRSYPHLLPKLYWRDDTVLLPCLSRSGEHHVYAVGRRMDWHKGDPYPKYLLPSCAHGARRAPYGLTSLSAAAAEGGTLIICEGSIDALGSVAMGTHAMGMLGRPCTGDVNDAESACARQLLHLLDDLKKCREVLVLPDYDGETKSTIDGLNGAGRLVSWLRARGVNATLVSMTDLGLGGFKDLAEASAHHKQKG